MDGRPFPRPPGRRLRDGLALSLSVSLLALAKLIDHPYREAWRLAAPLLGYAGAKLIAVATARAGKHYLERRMAQRLRFVTRQANACTPGTRRWLRFSRQPTDEC